VGLYVGPSQVALQRVAKENDEMAKKLMCRLTVR
jgi:hypothetical protein